MDTIDLEAYQYGDTNITGIRLIDPENPLMENLKKFLNEMNQEYEEPDEEFDNDDAEKEPESRGKNQLLKWRTFSFIISLAIIEKSLP